MTKNTTAKNIYTRVSSYKNDAIVILSLVGGIFAMIVIIASIPQGSFISKPIKATLGLSSDNSGDDSENLGTYDLGTMQLSLGRRQQYLDSNITLEYDRGLLKLTSKGLISSESKADKFFEGKDQRIRSIIISVASKFSYLEFSTEQGINDFKDSIVDAINRSVMRKRSHGPITNVYFSSFTLLSSERERDA